MLQTGTLWFNKCEGCARQLTPVYFATHPFSVTDMHHDKYHMTPHHYKKNVKQCKTLKTGFSNGAHFEAKLAHVDASKAILGHVEAPCWLMLQGGPC